MTPLGFGVGFVLGFSGTYFPNAVALGGAALGGISVGAGINTAIQTGDAGNWAQVLFRATTVGIGIGGTKVVTASQLTAAFDASLWSQSTSTLGVALFNFGSRTPAGNAAVLSNYPEGSFFSCVLDPITGKFLAQPSGNTMLNNGVVPAGLVERNGGHAMVNGLLSKLIGSDTSRAVGFTLNKVGNGFKIMWNSISVNFENFNDAEAPANYKPAIIEAVQSATGQAVQE